MKRREVRWSSSGVGVRVSRWRDECKEVVRWRIILLFEDFIIYYYNLYMSKM